MQRIKNVEEVLLQLKSLLRKYLEEHNTYFKGSLFTCPNRAHHTNEDNKPSAGFIPNSGEQAFHCFACGASGDIFKAYSLLENKDISGKNWYLTLKELADRYNIEYELEPLSKEEEEFNNVQEFLKNIVNSAHKYLIKNHPRKVMDYLRKRSWGGCIDFFQLGYLPPDNQAVKKYVTKAFSQYPELGEYLSVNIKNPESFIKKISGKLLYPIKHRYGYILGLVERTLDEEQETPKYIKHFVKFAQKKGVLFNLNTTYKTVFIVEGASSVFTLFLCGVKNVVAMLGSSFTPEMYNNLVKHGIEKIIFCFDGDSAGREGLKRALRIVKDKSDIKVLIKELPEGKDPDDLVTQEGIESFKKIPEISHFKYCLSKFKENSDNKQLKEELYDIFLSNKDGLIREKMLKLFAKELQIPKTILIQEIDKYEKRKSLISDVGVGELLQEEVSLIKSIERFEERAWSSGRLKGIPTGFPIFDEKIDGLQTGLVLVAGKWNVGKSAFMQTMALNLLNDPSNYVLYFSIDDPVITTTIPRFIANLSSIPINTVSNPLYRIEKNETLDTETKKILKENRDKALSLLKEYSTRLGVKDSSEGYDTSYIEKMIKIYRTIAGNRKLVVFVDFLNMVDLSSRKKVERTEQETLLARFFKRMSSLYDVPIVCTVEGTKEVAQSKMREGFIKGSSALPFRADLILLLSTDFEVNDKSNLYFYDDKGQAQPIIKLEVSKNKMSGFKKEIYFKFYREYCKFEECSYKEQQEFRGV